MKSRRKFSTRFKTQVVLEALSERYTMAQLAEKHQLHPNQINTWKNQFLQNAELVFSKGVKTEQQKTDEEKDRLLKTIGELKVKNDFLRNALR